LKNWEGEMIKAYNVYRKSKGGGGKNGERKRRKSLSNVAATKSEA